MLKNINNKYILKESKNLYKKKHIEGDHKIELKPYLVLEGGGLALVAPLVVTLGTIA